MNADDGAPLSNRHKVRDLRLRDARAPVPTARKTRADELEEPLIAVPIKSNSPPGPPGRVWHGRR